ncbi:MAG: AraC family transcriptional regulator [Chitinophagales bacterium]|nr:AraC family transcriptional regulator [Chitinophagales bacterium]
MELASIESVIHHQHYKAMSDKQKDFYEKEFKINEKTVRGSVCEKCCCLFKIRKWKLNFTESTSLRVNCNKEFVNMVFIKQGMIDISNLINKECILSSNQHNLIYGNQPRCIINCKEGEFLLYEISLDTNFIEKFLMGRNAVIDTFVYHIKNKKSALIKDRHGRITLNMSEIIEQMNTCTCSVELKRLFLEAKISELLLIQLDYFKQPDILDNIKATEIDKIYKVKDFIIQNYEKNYTLYELAQIVGTNDFTLKKYFKKLFGTTVFEFWREHRLKIAHGLIMKGEMSIKEISYNVGYQNPQHFTAAFKKQYNILPNKLKNLYKS